MPSRIEILGKNGASLGMFETHLSADEAAATLEEEGLAGFADWSGDFWPSNPADWTKDDSDNWLLNGEQFYRAADQIGDVTELREYVVTTDGFQWNDTAADLDEAIETAFAGEGLGKITDRDSLERRFAKYVADGGWCWIEEDGVRVLEIGKC